MIDSVALFSSLVLTAATPAELDSNRSLLLITLDTMRADRLGCYGYAAAATPTIDRLARTGAKFTQALSPVPLTLPAHASIFTGQPPRLHGVRDNGLQRLPDAVETITERFHAAGLATIGVVGAAVLDRSTGIAQGFDQFDDRVRQGRREWFDWRERSAEQVVDAALARLDGRTGRFFLWVHFYDAHFPYLPPGSLRERFARAPYDGELAAVDAAIARLLDGLAQRRLDRSLVIALVGDHGEGLGEHGEAQHGLFLYQATQQVPLILHGPGIPPGRVIDQRVGLIDLAPTLLELFGLPPLPRVAGRSLVPACRGKPLPEVDYELETIYPQSAFGWAPLRGIVRGAQKAIDAPTPELYDLRRDPTERIDRSAVQPATMQRLLQAIAARFAADKMVSSPPAMNAEERERLARLSALGYVSSGAPSNRTAAVDPKRAIGVLQRLEQARALLANGQPDSAVTRLEPDAVAQPNNLQLQLTYCSALLAAGREDEARRRLTELHAQHPYDPYASFLAGQAWRRAGPAGWANAEQALRDTLRLDPRHADATLSLALLYLDQRNAVAAKAVLAAAAEHAVDDPALWALSGTIAAREQRPTDALAAFERALALDPSLTAALRGKAELHYQQGDLAAAVAAYRAWLAREPRASTARTLGAILLHRMNDPAGARTAFEQALQLDPTGPEAAETQALLNDLRR